ncbi:MULTISPECIES: zinc-dependent alcohol dehydrogenase family protein [Rhodomicrobium]|uniref:zinc-dependent alcohol dehydrogenase family protein n=1 Tax=Rhodomicrobium TaxID=1068 RepID=UPI000B4B24E7|nr:MULTISPECIES: zinc-dependent alcohol dehydrogenase family protein [Rhodomicrobium]
MQAALLEAYGAPLRLAPFPRPQAEAGQVLVRIRTSGVNPLDLKIQAGAAAHAKQPAPAVLGIDMAGIVEAVGPGVTGFKAGDAVYGMTGGVGGLQGSLAAFAAVDARLLAAKPDAIGWREAAALPLSFITAWEGLVDRAGVQAGQTVLVQGGAGGVGHIAVQLARALGAKVFAVDSAEKAGFLARLGASAIDRARMVADYVDEHTGGRGFDIVYDTVGGAVLDASFQAVRRFGHVVSCLGWGTHALAPLSFRAATYSGVFTLLPLLTGEGREHFGEIMREATRLVEAGGIVPQLDPRRFTLQTVEQAYDAIRARSATGKLVIDIGAPG